MTPSSFSDPDPTGPTASSGDHLWTPWRMRYVVDDVREDGCVFCNRLTSNQDADSLILHRGDRAFIIMNLFPYNTGHVMIVPNAHTATLEDADPETLSELASLRAPLLRALRRALSPEGFNLGLNIGAIAGAGVAGHLHEHVVPRWLGDANFMPVIASTTVMPELIPVTYAKIRSELARELGNSELAISVVFSQDGCLVLTEAGRALPRVGVVDGEPVWRTILRDALSRGAVDAELVGWAGSGSACDGPSALVFRSSHTSNGDAPKAQTWVPVETALEGPDGSLVRSALEMHFQNS